MRILRFMLLTAAAILPASTLSVAPIMAAEPDARGSITIPAGTGRVMHLRAPATNIFTADPKVAEVRPASPDSLFVWGVAAGTTTIAALSNTGEAIGQFQVNVTPSGYDARQTDLRRDQPQQPARPRNARRHGAVRPRANAAGCRPRGECRQGSIAQ